MPDGRRLFSERDLASYLDIPVTTLRYWRYCSQDGPPVYRVGRRVRYDLAEVDAWLEGNRDEPWGVGE